MVAISLRVLIADDHDLVRDGMRPYIERLAENVEVLEASSFSEVLTLREATPPLSLVLLDLHMPGMVGLSSVADACKAFPGIPVVVISGASDSTTINAVLSHGAAGFVPKTSKGKLLVSALKFVLDGGVYIPPAAMGRASQDARSNGDSPPASVGSSILSTLNAREDRTLRLLMGGKTNKEIARALELQEITIKVHLRSIFRKIGATNRTDAVRIAMTNGWS